MVKNITPSNISIHNHIDGCLQMHSKKLLFKNLYNHLKKYQQFNIENNGIHSVLFQLHFTLIKVTLPHSANF